MSVVYCWPADRNDVVVQERLAPGDAGLPDEVVATVRNIIDEVRSRGDDALIEFTARFDGEELSDDALRVSREEIAASAENAPPALRAAIERAITNVRAFHEKQRLSGYRMDVGEGASLSWVWKSVGAAALYVPGGRAAYPSTVVMNAVPAQVAGVKRIAVLTVPGTVENNPAVAFALQALGLDEVYRVAGAQSVAAAAYGTATIEAVDVIVGPGNAYVAAAKREVYGRVGIDSVAGPSEVLILADESADPRCVAADLLAQAEHDPLARCVLACTSREVIEATLAELDEQLADAPRKEVMAEAWRDHGLILDVDTREELVEICEIMAPEHLQVMTDPPLDVESLTAGAVFVGNATPTALGDYIAGPNHVLPTGGTARFSGPLGVHVFMRPMSVIRGTAEWSAGIVDDGACIADYEALHGHAVALRLRSKKGATS